MRSLIISCILLFSLPVLGQNVADYFVPSANHYLQNQNKEALEVVKEGLEKLPNNKKLLELKKKIEEQQEKNKEQGDTKEGDQPDQDAEKSADKSDTEQESAQNDGRNKGEQGTGSSDKDPLEAEGEEPSDNVQDQGERLQKQRYDNILKALENQEQETQRRLMMGDSKSKLGRKQKDW